MDWFTTIILAIAQVKSEPGKCVNVYLKDGGYVAIGHQDDDRWYAYLGFSGRANIISRCDIIPSATIRKDIGEITIMFRDDGSHTSFYIDEIKDVEVSDD